jgi:hypothetical protein
MRNSRVDKKRQKAPKMASRFSPPDRDPGHTVLKRGGFLINRGVHIFFLFRVYAQENPVGQAGYPASPPGNMPHGDTQLVPAGRVQNGGPAVPDGNAGFSQGAGNGNPPLSLKRIHPGLGVAAQIYPGRAALSGINLTEGNSRYAYADSQRKPVQGS